MVPLLTGRILKKAVREAMSRQIQRRRQKEEEEPLLLISFLLLLKA
jgi:hypothetical protein